MSAVLAARKRTHSVISEDDDNRQTSPSPPIQSCGTTHSIPTGLDWKWVKALDQSSVDDLPAPFHAPDTLSYTGEVNDRPILKTNGDLGEYTHWVLARIRRMPASSAVAKMLDDPHVSVKWTLSLRTRYRNQIPYYKDLSLNIGQATNHEATYTQMCGIVLPPEQSCTNCKAGNGKFRHCVVLPGYLKGACAGCHYSINGTVCSHRPDAIKSKRIRVSKLERPALNKGAKPVGEQEPPDNRDLLEIKDLKDILLDVRNVLREKHDRSPSLEHDMD